MDEQARRMTPLDVQRVYGLTAKHQAKLRAKRQIPFYKLSSGRSGRVYYDVAELEQWWKARRVNPKEGASDAA
jgi:hypothetical protein